MADFYPNTFIESEKLVHRYLLVPDQTTIPSRKPFGDIRDPEWRSFIRSIKNVSEWMAVNKGYFDMSGFRVTRLECPTQHLDVSLTHAPIDMEGKHYN